MAFPRKKLKHNQLNPLAFEIQNSPIILEINSSSNSNSNSGTPQYRERSSNNKKSNFCIFSGQNASSTTSLEGMNGYSNCQNQQNTLSTQNILISEQYIADEKNDVEVRINEWLDNHNIVMVRPEDIIHDFYHKIRTDAFKRMEIELSEFQATEESAQSSLTELDYDSLDYSHSKDEKRQKKIRELHCSREQNSVDIEVEESLCDRKVKRKNKDLQIISSLLHRRQNNRNNLSITGIVINRYQY